MQAMFQPIRLAKAAKAPRPLAVTAPVRPSTAASSKRQRRWKTRAALKPDIASSLDGRAERTAPPNCPTSPEAAEETHEALGALAEEGGGEEAAGDAFADLAQGRIGGDKAAQAATPRPRGR